jgi:putative transcriptional regulator
VITFFTGPTFPFFLLNAFAKNEKTNLTKAECTALKKMLSARVEMKKKLTPGQRMIESARQALVFAGGESGHGCEVYVPADVDVKAIREKISLSQAEFAKLFGLSKRTLEHWEHGRRVPTGPARAFLMVIAREPEAVRRALLA